jgi:hypothetical protein
MGGACGTYGRKRTQGFRWGKLLQERSYLLDVDKRVILKWIANKLFDRARTGFIWLKMGTSGGPL